MIWIPFYVYWFIKKGERNMANNMRKMYTEKQISDIAKSSVSGGTKLYLHTLEFKDAYDNDITIYVISLENNEIEITSLIMLTRALHIYDNNGYIAIFDFDTDTIYNFANGIYNSVGEITSIISDTVTPL